MAYRCGWDEFSAVIFNIVDVVLIAVDVVLIPVVLGDGTCSGTYKNKQV